MLKLEGNLVVPDVWLTYFHTYLYLKADLYLKRAFLKQLTKLRPCCVTATQERGWRERCAPGCHLYLFISVFVYLCIWVFVYLCICICVVVCVTGHPGEGVHPGGVSGVLNPPATTAGPSPSLSTQLVLTTATLARKKCQKLRLKSSKGVLTVSLSTQLVLTTATLSRKNVTQN